MIKVRELTYMWAHKILYICLCTSVHYKVRIFIHARPHPCIPL